MRAREIPYSQPPTTILKGRILPVSSVFRLLEYTLLFRPDSYTFCFSADRCPDWNPLLLAQEERVPLACIHSMITGITFVVHLVWRLLVIHSNCHEFLLSCQENVSLECHPLLSVCLFSYFLFEDDILGEEDHYKFLKRSLWIWVCWQLSDAFYPKLEMTCLVYSIRKSCHCSPAKKKKKHTSF